MAVPLVAVVENFGLLPKETAWLAGWALNTGGGPAWAIDVMKKPHKMAHQLKRLVAKTNFRMTVLCIDPKEYSSLPATSISIESAAFIRQTYL
jgi:hypothetical protein